MKSKILQIQRYRDIAKEFCGSDYDMMVDTFYQKIGKDLFEKRERVRESIKTISRWEKERQKIKKNLIDAIGAGI